MELVDGQPLSALLRPGSPMDPDVARDLMAQAATALGAAHAAGIVHRDVKPGNLIVTPDRRVKVTDFGIARAAEAIPLTQTGQVMGTPQYLSPEQAEGRGVSPASDVYSLGVVAFECLAGRRPFAADSPVATALAHVRQPVPDLPEHVPADLAAVVRRSMAKDPAQRYDDGSAFAAALRDPSGEAATVVAAGAPIAGAAVPATAVLPSPSMSAAGATASQQQTIPGPPPDDRRRTGGTPWWAWVLLLLALLIGAVVLVQALGDEETPPPAGPSETTEPTTDAPTTTEPTSDPTTTSPTTEPTEEPSTVEIDEGAYLGRDHKDVEKELRDLGVEPRSEQVDNDGSHEEGTVASVQPSGTVEEGSTVTVTYYGPPPEDEGDGEGEGNGQGDGGPGGGNNGNGSSGNGNSGEGDG
jgi:serine/threonine-protein kinase